MAGRGAQAQSFRFGGIVRVAGIAALAVIVAACHQTGQKSRLGVSASERVVAMGDAVPKGGGSYKVGKPYQIAGRWFHPKEDPAYDTTGNASWYGDDFHGRKTANGEVYDMHALTAAHPTLPMPTYARVTNLENGRSVVVRINDRGPFSHNRVIDLSKRTADLLDFRTQGTAEVRVQYVGPAPLDGNDEWLTTTVRHDGAPVSPVMVAGIPQPEAAPTSVPMPPNPPMPQEASGPQQTFAWVSGYATGSPDMVSEAFRLFDGGDLGVVVLARRAH